MESLSNSEIYAKYPMEFRELIDYFNISLKKLNIVGAVTFGSVIRQQGSVDKSDIDIVAYSGCFSREQSQLFIEEIKLIGGDFLDKQPIFIEDFISPRIEYFLKINELIFDINIFPPTLGGYTERYENAVHDSIELIVGAMYINGKLLFGHIPFEKVIISEFLPFYQDDLRARRMKVLKERIIKINEKIKNLEIAKSDDLLYYVYKSRKYLIKWIFINNRKYPIDLERYLEYQLTDCIGIERSAADALLLKGDSIDCIARKYLCVSEELLSNERG